MSDLKCITLANTAIPLSDKVNILLLRLIPILQWDFILRHYLSRASIISALRQVRSSLDDATAASVASTLVSSRLDQMNSVLYGTAG